jgi:hypothetical protein
MQLLDEHRIPLCHAARLWGPEGQPVHLSTVVRAITRGLKLANGERVRLEAIRAGGRWHTSREAVARFIARLTDSAFRRANPIEPAAASTATISKRRQQELARVGAELDAAGIVSGPTRPARPKRTATGGR